jgi:DNA polymerase
MSEFTCSKCDICILNNHHPIIGDGNLDANIMFITRNPSAFEVKNNVPLINKEGMLFQKYLDLFNFSREDIYITHAVKCKTPGHRIPVDKEIVNCYEHLDKEISTVNPKIIVLIGETAIRAYFKLAYTNKHVDIFSLNAKSTIHNDRVIIFMLTPSYGLGSMQGKELIYQAFITLLNEYRKINPLHEININI